MKGKRSLQQSIFMCFICASAVQSRRWYTDLGMFLASRIPSPYHWQVSAGSLRVQKPSSGLFFIPQASETEGIGAAILFCCVDQNWITPYNSRFQSIYLHNYLHSCLTSSVVGQFPSRFWERETSLYLWGISQLLPHCSAGYSVWVGI